MFATLRIDALSRYFNIPLTFTGKAGWDTFFFVSESGGDKEASGHKFGFRYVGQLAFELDVIDRRSARALDDEWGINHSYIYFEGWGTTTATFGQDFTWVGGLGMII